MAAHPTQPHSALHPLVWTFVLALAFGLLCAGLVDWLASPLPPLIIAV